MIFMYTPLVTLGALQLRGMYGTTHTVVMNIVLNLNEVMILSLYERTMSVEETYVGRIPQVWFPKEE